MCSFFFHLPKYKNRKKLKHILVRKKAKSKNMEKKKWVFISAPSYLGNSLTQLGNKCGVL